ncbi:hypothetical protein H671_1g0239 [Cricetulus griseus]|nr:hypothetical protein H671_1g0239 [Cricetulus griseus]
MLESHHVDAVFTRRLPSLSFPTWRGMLGLDTAVPQVYKKSYLRLLYMFIGQRKRGKTGNVSIREEQELPEWRKWPVPHKLSSWDHRKPQFC